jgi:hypothetical protein
MNTADHSAQAEQPPGTNPPGPDDRPQPETSTAPSTAQDSTDSHWKKSIEDELEARSRYGTSDRPPLEAGPQ